MGNITTTTQGTPLQFPSNTLVDRNPRTGHLFAMVKASTANTFEVWRSTDGGTNWAPYASLVRANVQEIGSIFVTNVQWLHWCYRTHEGNQDRIYWRRLNLTTAAWSAEVLTGSPSNGGTPSSIHSGLDLYVVVASGQEFVAIAAGTQLGASHGVTLYGVRINTSGVAKYDNAGVFINQRQWLHPGTGRITPSIDVAHNGDGKSSAVPHLYVAWGRTDVYLALLTWGWRWTGPSRPSKVNPTALTPAQDSVTGRWDGSRFLIAVPDPVVTSRVQVIQRTRGNGTLDTLQSPDHPAGVVKNCSMSHNHINGDLRVFAVGTNNPDLHFVDYQRSLGTWTSWATVSTTDIVNSNQYSVRRGTAGSTRHDIYTAHPGSPNQLTHTSQNTSHAPNPPVWDTVAIGYVNGAAADVNAALPLDWMFSDPNPEDTQSAYALSRQIGVGTLAYWRASDSTWQPTEQKNVTSTSLVTLASGWALTSDQPHTYRVKTWDSADVAGLYGDGFTVVPSGRIDPAVTSPAEGATITTAEVTLVWTAAEQTAFRVRLEILGSVVHDSGWITGTDTSYTVPATLADGFNYSAFLTTRNLEGLASNTVQRNFGVDFVPPPIGTTVATPMPDEGFARVVVTNPAPVGVQPAFTEQELWHRPVTSQFLNTNQSFETDLTGWGPAVGGVASRANDFAKFGAWSLKLVPDGVTATVDVESSPISVTPGVSYHADGWIRAATVNKPVAVFLRWYTAGDVFISESSAPAVPLAAGAFLYHGPIAVAPPTAAFVTIGIRVSDTPAPGDIIWGDGLRVRVTDPAEGLRVGKGLPSGATVDDWFVESGVDFEHRVIVLGANGTASHGPWTP